MLKLGVVGIGGYASHVWKGALDAMGSAEPVKLVATCDPRADAQPRFRDELLGRGIPVLEQFDELLKRDIDAVWLPIPIDLHREYTERALAAGKAVVVEKPAAGSIDEVDAMIAARDRAKLPVVVGFQNLFDPNTREAKRRVLSGAIGEVRSASVVGCWPRGESYYTRAAWAGRTSRDGTWVLDSPLNNAMAHFVNLALFLLGEDDNASAVPDSVEADLFRAYQIEMFDTCSVRVTLRSGATLMVAMTHACRQPMEPVVTLEGSRGTLRFLHEANRYEFCNPEGRATRVLQTDVHPIRQIIRQFGSLMAGNRDAPVATLENARSHTLLVNAVSEAAAVAEVPSSAIDLISSDYSGPGTRAIRGIEGLLRDSAARSQLVSRLPSSPFVARSGRFDLRDYRRFAGPRVETRPRSAVRDAHHDALSIAAQS